MSDLSATQIYHETREICHTNVYKHLAIVRKSLFELKSTSKKALFENNLFWQKEVERAKQEKDQEWQDKIDLVEAENKKLRTVIENLTKLEGSNVTSVYELWEAENEIDKLSRQLDDKVIQNNKLQIALSEKSKEIYELEKSCTLLCYEYKKLHRENCRLKKLNSQSEIDKGNFSSS